MAEKPESLRRETDSLGEIEVPADRYWGAQTQRARGYFAIGQDLMPLEVIYALALLKKAAALANRDLGKLPADKADLIIRAAEEILAGSLDDNFPLAVWISGSGTQANMNVNEVIANRANEMATGLLGSKEPVHPNDHVNLSQSTNDVFPAAMHLAAALAIRDDLIPIVRRLREALHAKAESWGGIVKIGRTHLQEALPLTLGQEFSGYVGMLDDGLERLEAALAGLCRLALGGTAVGTGFQAPPEFAARTTAQIAAETGLPFVPAPNKFALMGAHDDLVIASGVLRTLAVSLYKIGNDIRLLAAFHELALPVNEPGSSIMPGKANPTQCEALAMVAVQVMGLDAAVAFAGAGGHLEMNVYKPLLIFNVLQSVRLLADVCRSFSDFCVAGLEPNPQQIEQYVQGTLMLVTALSPLIGYDQAARIAHLAREKGLALREAALELGVAAADFDRLVDPLKMTRAEEA